MHYFMSLRGRLLFVVIVRVILFASLLGQMWPVNAIQARTPASVADIVNTPVPPAANALALQPTDRPIEAVATPTPVSTEIAIEPTALETSIPSPTVEVTPNPATPAPTVDPTVAPWPIEEVPLPSDESKDAQKGQETSFVGGRVNMIVPDSVDVAKLRVQMKQAKRLKRGEEGFAFVIDITAKDKKDQDTRKFPESITLTLKIADLLSTLGRNIFVAYFDESTQAWVDYDIVARDERAGTVTVLTDHFTLIGGGTTNL